MATYYPSSNNQRDAAPMHYLREPLPTSYSEVPVLPTNMMYMSYPSSSGSYSDTLAGNAQQHNHNCIEIPSVAASDSTQPQHEILSSLSGSHIVEHDFSAWRDGKNEMLVMNSLGGPASLLHTGQHLQAQGLSLSLGTQIPSGIQIPSIQYRNPNQGFTSFLSPTSSVSGEVDPSSYGMSSIARTIPHSKYLKAAQQLLDEVVNVRKALKQPDSEKNQNIHELWKASNPQEPVSNSSSELSPAERQDLQNKLTKLLAMLDEVDRRYKQYYHQMQIVVSSFDVIAGSGAAKPYTALALQTISRHFRCLRDAITGQIRATRRSLGEQDTSGNGKGVGISRLRYVDQQLRQQRALQQLGMMQQHAWRPQRGLPESSVSILRAWLFEHFLHPYPKDSDKIMLARQTGLTRSQVSNWFINARVRLWKPMVEEMYKEEIGDADMDSNSSSENAPKATKSDIRASEERGDDFQPSTTSTECSSLFPDGIVQSDGGSDRFMAAAAAAYHMSELGRFGSGTGVSLTLGLQHCEGGSLPISNGGHHSFVGMRGADMYNPAASSVGTDTADFDCMDPGNRQHRFSSSHLLHDFVA
ncbi:unnamed protein product, partial [Vitis vinifera]